MKNLWAAEILTVIFSSLFFSIMVLLRMFFSVSYIDELLRPKQCEFAFFTAYMRLTCVTSPYDKLFSKHVVKIYTGHVITRGWCLSALPNSPNSCSMRKESQIRFLGVISSGQSGPKRLQIGSMSQFYMENMFLMIKDNFFMSQWSKE